MEDLPAGLGGLEQALLAWNRTYETTPPIKPWATRHQNSSITTGSILMPHERRSCSICPDPIQALVLDAVLWYGARGLRVVLAVVRQRERHEFLKQRVEALEGKLQSAFEGIQAPVAGEVKALREEQAMRCGSRSRG